MDEKRVRGLALLDPKSAMCQIGVAEKEVESLVAICLPESLDVSLQFLEKYAENIP